MSGATSSATGETVSIEVLLPDGQIEPCLLRISTTPEGISISAGADEKEFIGEDVFDAFLALRRAFEEADCRVVCAGARLDTYPSGMSRSMGGGRKAYILEVGSTPRLSDIIDIFAPAEPSQVVTVDQQILFFREWAKSNREGGQ